MKQSYRILTFFTLIALLVVALGVNTQPAKAATTYVCIPDCSTTDGRMLSLASVGYQTLAGLTMYFKLSVPGTLPSFDLGFFDGDTGGLWDLGTTQLVYTLYADPTASGGTSQQVAQWTGLDMTNNAWKDFNVPQDPRAQAPSGAYFYTLNVVLPNAFSTQTWSNFKVRSNTPVELSSNQSFAYSVPLFTLGDAAILYPNGLPTSFPNNVATTFDGTWDMYIYVPTSIPAFTIWDGDMDFGSYNCSVNDTNDPDTPAGIPSFALGTSTVAQGVATSLLKCSDLAGNPIIGPAGQTYTTGDPTDDSRYPAFQRSGPVTYDVTDPNGNVYHNGNPSGNLEWEQFRIDSNPNTPADYHITGVLPAGIYHIHISGLDVRNLNAWHLMNGAKVCVNENGTPCVPVLHPYLIGDTVWNDANGNGVQDAGEPGIPGVNFTLLDSNGLPVPGGTATTDANGKYQFSVDPGTYYVQLTLPSGYTFTQQYAGGDTTLDSNANVSTGLTDKIVVSNANDLTIDAGMYQPASLGDFVWNDLNGNGIQDASEPGIQGVAVNLLNAAGTSGITSTTTDANGNYTFPNLAPGTYQVQFVLPAGDQYSQYLQGSDTTKDSNANPASAGQSGPITLSSGQTDTSWDAGLTLPASLGDFVWNDLNSNGIQDSGEPGLPGVTVNLLNAAGTSGITSTTTDANGSYSFPNLAPGTYQVQFVLPTGDQYSQYLQGSNPAVDSNANPASAGQSGPITLSSGQTDTSWDAGLYQPGSVTGNVYNDLNGNGGYDNGEPGISGVTVTLSNGATAVTDSGGFYSFTNLVPGTYSVTETDPAGYTSTGDTQGANDNLVGSILVTAGTTASGNNFFDWQPGSITGTVYNDLNGNGSFNTGEPGISGVTVTLSNGAIAVTDSSGNYSFTNLPAGTYSVTETDLAGYTSTGDTQGANDNLVGSILVTAGATASGNNFFDWQPGSITGTVYNDLNGNGSYNAGEPGISGVTVTLSNGATAVTDSNGNYSFTNLPAGTYSVTETDLPGYTSTGDTQGANDNLVGSILVTAGATASGNNFFDWQPGSITGTVYNDLNGNGSFNTGEPGISGVTVTLSNGATTVTDSNGNYSFTNLAPGTYSVTETDLPGYTSTGDTQGANDNVVGSIQVTAGTTASGNNFFDWQPGSITGTVYNDLNGNGSFNTGEPGISGVTVTLSNGATAVTDSSGNYSFTNLPAGTYSVTETDLAGYTSTGDTQGANDNIVGNIVVTAGATASGNNFFDWQLGTITGYVYNDLNGNGSFNTGEPGISGVTVTLRNSGGTVVATTTTGTNGDYSFTNLVPGTYSVTETDLPGYTSTGDTQGANDNVVGNIVVTAGATASGNNFFDWQLGTITGYVYNDLNGNGGFNTGEPGISGVTVTLRNSGGTVVATTTTGTNGDYSFTNLPAGTYSVTETDPAGYTSTGDTQGANDNVVGSILVTAGATASGNNFFDWQPGSLGDFVWNDQNGNGIQDTGEPGLSGLTVKLVGSDGSTVLASTTTGTNGSYSFANLAPGTYYVLFAAPSGYTFTLKNAAGSTTANDSNAIVSTGVTDAITLAAGATNNTIDAGLYQSTASLGDFVWNDQNGNGIQDTGEPGLSGVTVKLLGSDGSTVLASTTTGTNGSYSFANLGPGTYYVLFAAPSGYSFTLKNAAGSTTANDSNASPSTGKTDAITLAAGATNNTIDAGLYQSTASLGDFVWNDKNGNGIQDTGEPGLSGLTVKLLGSDGSTVLASTPTGTNGSYSFANLAPGTYYVQFAAPSGYSFTLKNVAGSTTANDSNVIVSTGVTDAITLAAGATDNTIDAGLYQSTASLGDFVWNDLNGNGIQNTGEPGLSGVTVKLLGSNGTTVLGTTTTNGSGGYSFTNLAAGTYYVQFTAPSGYAFTLKNVAGSTTANDSNVNPSTGKTDAITLASGATDNTIDAGLYQSTASLGDFVWNDKNGNGIQDGGETGISGVTVKLLGSDGTTVVATTTTDSSGKYSFSVAPGTYYVQFVAPGGYVYTQYLQGTNTGLDSNANPASSGKSAAITVISGQSDASWDAGLVAASCTTGSGTWNFNNPVGLLGTSQTYTVNGLTITAYGYASPSTPTALYGKNDGGDEHGLGLASDTVNHEIDTNHYIQLDLGELQAAGVLNAQIEIGSMQTGEPAAVYGSNTQGSLGTLVSTVPTTADNTFFSIPGFPAYRYYSVKANAATPANVTLEAVSFNCTPVTSTIGDFVWKDTNGNGIQDSGETGLSGLTVKLLGSDGTTVLVTTTTNGSGIYSFANLAPGTYYVQFAAPSGYAFTLKNVSGSTTANDSNANPSTGKTDAITLTAGATDNTIDAGLYQPASIGDFVWNDINGNGIQNTGEPGLSGVTVKLLGSNGTAVLGSTTTNGSGIYSFANLAPGTYYVQFAAPSGYAFTLKNVAGSTTANDSNVNPSTSKTDAITLAAGATDNSIDAGLKQPFVCTGNLVLNPSFELNTGSPPTNWTNGTAGNIGIPSPDGNNVGYITGTGIIYQKVNVASGNSYTLTFFSGSHVPSIQTVKIQYFTSSNTAIGSASVHTITSDLEVSGFGGPYTLTLAAAPSNAKYLKIMVSANNQDYAKVDALCLKAGIQPAAQTVAGPAAIGVSTPTLNGGAVVAPLQSVAQSVNLCTFIRTPSFWKNYSKSMPEATFLDLLNSTQDFKGLSIKDALTILAARAGGSKLSQFNGVDAVFLKSLLAAELNAAWNGQNKAAAPGGQLGLGSYQAAVMTVNAALGQSYSDLKNFSADENAWVIYLGSGGTSDSLSACQVQP